MAMFLNRLVAGRLAQATSPVWGSLRPLRADQQPRRRNATPWRSRKRYTRYTSLYLSPGDWSSAKSQRGGILVRNIVDSSSAHPPEFIEITGTY